MRPLMNQTHQSQTLSSRITIRTAAKLLAILLIVVAVPLALYVRVKSEDSARFSKAEESRRSLLSEPKSRLLCTPQIAAGPS